MSGTGKPISPNRPRARYQGAHPGRPGAQVASPNRLPEPDRNAAGRRDDICCRYPSFRSHRNHQSHGSALFVPHWRYPLCHAETRANAAMDQVGTAKPPQYPIESVDNALRLLLLLGERAEVRLTEASVYLDVASSTAHRLLSMLQYRGFVRQDPISKAYLPGPALTGVAFAVFARMDIPRIAAPILRQLSDALQETVHIGMLDGRTVRFIAALESPSAVRVVSRLGRTMPAHCTSTGKAMLANFSDEELHKLYPDPNLEQLTTHSVRTLTQLCAELVEVRKTGFATSREESEEGVASVAVAIPARGPRHEAGTQCICAELSVTAITCPQGSRHRQQKPPQS